MYCICQIYYETLGTLDLGPQTNRGAFHQLLSIILKLRILVLLPVSNLPFVVKVKNYSLIGE
jgi:hypothetical protein